MSTSDAVIVTVRRPVPLPTCASSNYQRHKLPMHHHHHHHHAPWVWVVSESGPFTTQRGSAHVRAPETYRQADRRHTRRQEAVSFLWHAHWHWTRKRNKRECDRKNDFKTKVGVLLSLSTYSVDVRVDKKWFTFLMAVMFCAEVVVSMLVVGVRP